MTSSSFSSCRAAILLRSRNFQWYYNSAPGPWSNKAEEQWQKYTDVENEIIEDAYNEKKLDIVIDCGHVIHFQRLIQYKNDDKDKQCPIKRVQLDRPRNNIHLREERFSLPVTIVPVSSNQEIVDNDALVLLRVGYITAVYGRLEVHNKDKTLADIVEEAAQGLIKEGNILGKIHEAHWLAKQLIEVKHHGTNIKAKSYHATEVPIDIGQTCIYLYTKESFWYKLINQFLRDAPISHEQIKTVGPFCWLLHLYLSFNETPGIAKVYRGLSLTNEQREELMKDRITFTCFTSTSRNRELAECTEQFDDDISANGNSTCGQGITIDYPEHMQDKPTDEQPNPLPEPVGGENYSVGAE